jgi:ATP-dependent DNA helicase RecG
VDPKARYESDDLSWLERPDRRVEGQWIERKEWCDAKKVAEAISAFANGQPPGGLFILGVSTDGKIVGVGERMPAAEEMLARLRTFVDNCGWTYRWVTAADGIARVVLLYVPFSEKRVVCLSDGTAFQRIGESSRRLSTDEIQELKYARQELHFEDEPAIPYAPDVLDPDMVQALLDGLKKRNGLTMPLTIDNALEARRLVARTRHGVSLTHAGLLAVGRDPVAILGGAYLRFLRFEGTVERVGAARNVIKDRTFEGPIPRIVSQFRDFMRTQVREFDYLGPEGKFITDVEYPEPAWEEAIVNALVHRSYRSNGPVFVRMFEDRLEIASPGGFPTAGLPSPVDIATLSTNPRNPHLCNALQYFDLVRLVREGTRRMLDEMTMLGLPPPTIEESKRHDEVTVTLRNDIEERRKRAGVGDAAREWDTIATYLREPQMIFRKRAVENWRRLWKRGARPPAELVKSAFEIAKTDDLPPEDVGKLLALLHERHPPERGAVLSDRQLVALAAELTAGAFSARRDAESTIADMVSMADLSLVRVIEWLEAGQSETTTVDALLTALRNRLHRDPLPTPGMVERLAAVALRYAKSRPARQLYADITGRELPTT